MKDPNELIACQVCKTVNNATAKFCRECGSALEKSEPLEAVNQQLEEPQQAPQPQPEPEAPQPTGFEITDHEMAVFVGPRADYFLPKFQKIHSGRRKGWNTTVFLFGLLLGPVVSSFWFFNRKMKKIGALLLAAGVALTVLSFASMVPFFESFVGAVNQQIENQETYDGDDFEYNFDYDFGEEFDYWDEELDPYYTYPDDTSADSYYDDSYYDSLYDANYELGKSYVILLGVNFLLSLIQVGIAVITAIFADSWYYDFAVKSIYQCKQKGQDSDMDIARAGGTSSTLWIILLIAYVLSTVIATAAVFTNMILSIV